MTDEFKIDTRHVIEKFGGVTKLARAYNAYFEEEDEERTIKRIEKWRERGNINIHQWLKLKKLAKHLGIELEEEV